jgi:hypothetical protein
MAVKCIFCGGPADPGWETCGSCDIEQQQLIEQEREAERYADEYAREFAEKTYIEQDELKYLDDILFGGR